MKIGINTISWGLHISDLRNVLSLVADAGYKGVELSQRPDALGLHSGVKELIQLLNALDLSFLTIVGGTLRERVDFCEDVRPEYLYVEPWDFDNIPYATDRDIKVAFHPRVFAPNSRPDEYLRLTSKYKDLNIILDTAHAFLSGYDPTDAIQSLGEHLIAVHFKDWISNFGRSRYRYARGFVTLGNGNNEIALDKVLQFLQERNFQGWLVSEVDNARIEPIDSVRENAQWFIQRKLIDAPKLSQLKSLETLRLNHDENHNYTSAEARFRECLMFAMKENADTFYESVAKAFSCLVDSKLVTVSSFHVSHGQEFLTLRSHYPSDINYTPRMDNTRYELTGISIDRQAPATFFDLTKEFPGSQYGYPERQFKNTELIKLVDFNSMISVPVFNSGNQNSVRFVVNLFGNLRNAVHSQSEWYRFSRAVTQAADSMLDWLCTSAATQVNLLAGRCDTSKDFFRELVFLIQRVLDCEGVAIFVVNEQRDKLELRNGFTTGTKWKTSREEFYKKGEGITGNVWNNKEVVITDPRKDSSHLGKSTEVVKNSHINQNIWIPLIDSRNEVTGVIRCRNKLSSSHRIPGAFSNTDAAVLDSIAEAAAPHIQTLRSENIRSKALRRLMHELRSPISAIQSAAAMMQDDKRIRSALYYDFPADIVDWALLMQRLIINGYWLSGASDGLPLQAQPTLLVKHVIAPAVRQAKILLDSRNFQVSRIEYGDFDQISWVNIDRNQFQQVIFNLLANSIKYAYDDPGAFQIEIGGRRTTNHYIIFFRDWGPGIESVHKELIFEEGFRAPDIALRDVTGHGLGLWVARQVIESHGGLINVENAKLPFEIVIKLPVSLSIDVEAIERKR